MSAIASAINGPDGFLPIELSEVELGILKDWLRDAYLTRLQLAAPHLVSFFSNEPMVNYHRILHHLEGVSRIQPGAHSLWFPKTVRVLPPSCADVILRFGFIRHIWSEFISNGTGCFIRDEEIFGWPNITWRLVRPNSGDVGPMHADQWFSDIEGVEHPTGFKPIKVWISVYGSEKSGLLVVPGSHLQKHDYYVTERDGRKKPNWNGDEGKVRTAIPPCNPGQGIVFNHNLLHCGIENTSDQTRVSIDFTVYVPEGKL